MESVLKTDPREKKILVVDDDESICAFLKTLLEKEGFQTQVCTNGHDAVRIVKSEKIDLVILDWMMPVLSGFEVLKMLQTEEHEKIPVIVITARVTDKSTAEMIKQEMNVVEFVPKPIKHKVFLSNLHSIMKTSPPGADKPSQ